MKNSLRCMSGFLSFGFGLQRSMHSMEDPTRRTSRPRVHLWWTWSTPAAPPMPATKTRERLVNAAKQRFYRDGFRNVGIDAVLDDVGITKTAFYKHFESKDDLMVAVLQDVDRFLQQTFRQMVRERGGSSAAGQLHAILDVVK